MNLTAFQTRNELITWMDLHRCTPDKSIPQEGVSDSFKVSGSYKVVLISDINEFDAIESDRYCLGLHNGSYGIDKISYASGEVTVFAYQPCIYGYHKSLDYFESRQRVSEGLAEVTMSFYSEWVNDNRKHLSTITSKAAA